MLEGLVTESLLVRISLIALIPFAATVFGSLIIFVNYRFGEVGLDFGLGFAAGVMIYVTFVNLLIPSIDYGGIVNSLTGFAVGVALVKVLDVLIPHTRLIRAPGGSKDRRAVARVVLIALAIAIHNIPEGLAVGSSSVYSLSDGFAVSLAIALQDVPEGLAVAVPVANYSKSAFKGFLVGAFSGFTEYLAAFIALVAVLDYEILTPFMMAVSAGAMVYIVIHEIVPEVFGHEHDEPATLGFFLGLLLVMVLSSSGYV
ncbi:MAG: hypothetical protein B7O98_01020 [Zestosphaera tikiterensis]|uniref:ZIP family metal transporter n=1 Tax=Zestosphaera tikiterensis TaxID=1973259 RepID=A0A2R7Y914_9CREN|nr:MAG: hypothetical protein B7O98_01020 [Zestosphaera tikiterensis]